jgi:hypothetical protein
MRLIQKFHIAHASVTFFCPKGMTDNIRPSRPDICLRESAVNTKFESGSYHFLLYSRKCIHNFASSYGFYVEPSFGFLFPIIHKYSPA